jgi:hypothetical protein
MGAGAPAAARVLARGPTTAGAIGDFGHQVERRR